MAGKLFDLTDKVALVTGGSRGIGLAIARGFAKQGSDVAIVARSENKLAEAANEIQKATSRKVWTFAFDLEKTQEIESFFDEVVSKTGNIDILVNCAGTGRRAVAEDIELSDWDAVMKVNLTAVLVLSQAFCRHRKKTGAGGKIINIGSLMCKGARATTTSYAASKGGLLMLTKSFAVEWAKYNINANAIGPGYIETELTLPLREDENLNKWVLSKTPMARWGRPKDIAGAAVFLASGASDFVTGQILYVDGGWSAAV